jgi:hypothetical protein
MTTERTCLVWELNWEGRASPCGGHCSVQTCLSMTESHMGIDFQIPNKFQWTNVSANLEFVNEEDWLYWRNYTKISGMYLILVKWKWKSEQHELNGWHGTHLSHAILIHCPLGFSDCDLWIKLIKERLTGAKGQTASIHAVGLHLVEPVMRLELIYYSKKGDKVWRSDCKRTGSEILGQVGFRTGIGNTR